MTAPIFDDSNRVGSDACEKQAREAQNEAIHNHSMYQYLPVDCAAPQPRFPNFSYEHVNLRGRVGYGIADDCVVDTYSEMRNDPGQLTRDRCHIQLYERVFQGCPNLRPGVPSPDKEMPIIQGVSSTQLEGTKFACKKTLMEMTTNTPIPLIDCMQDIQDPKHIVEPWIRGGDATRDFVKRKELLEGGCLKPRK